MQIKCFPKGRCLTFDQLEAMKSEAIRQRNWTLNQVMQEQQISQRQASLRVWNEVLDRALRQMYFNLM